MKRRPFLFAAAFCLPVFSAFAAGAGRPVLRVAPSLAVAPPAPGPMIPGPGPLGEREMPLHFRLAPRFQDVQGFPVRIACIEITVVQHAGAGIPPEVTRIPMVRDPLWTVPFTIRTGGHATLRAIAEDGSVSAPRTVHWHDAASGCLIDPRKTKQLSHTFVFPAR